MKPSNAVLQLVTNDGDTIIFRPGEYNNKTNILISLKTEECLPDRVVALGLSTDDVNNFIKFMEMAANMTIDNINKELVNNMYPPLNLDEGECSA